MKRYHNGRFKSITRSRFRRRNSPPGLRESPARLTESPARLTESPAGSLCTTDSFNTTVDKGHLWQLLLDFHIHPNTISDVIAAGYDSIVRLLRMHSDIAHVFFGHLSPQLWHACVAYVQSYKIEIEDMDAVLDEPPKFEITLDGSSWSKFLKGGFQAHEFVLVAGESGLGKSMLMMSLAIRAADLGVTVYYLDADDKIDPECINVLAQCQMNKKEILQNIKRIKTFSRGELLAAIRHIQSVIGNSPVGSRHLLIVDSLTGSLRRELAGAENICQRHNILASCIDAMKKMAADNDRDVIVAATTEVAYACRNSHTNVYGLTPLGGCILQHSATTRIFLSSCVRQGFLKKVITLQSSARAPRKSMTYKITKVGIVLVRDMNDEGDLIDADPRHDN